MGEHAVTGKYVVISPARDEGPHIERTIQSIIRQTWRPQSWVIVDDGSQDETLQILSRYAAEFSWIKVLPLARDGERRPGSAVINAFIAGYKLVEREESDFVVKLDCDLEIPPQYFEILLNKFHVDPKLGIASGVYIEEHGGVWKPVKFPKYHAAGCSKIVRTECFRQIGGFIPERGWDTVDEIRAQVMGWKTCHFGDVTLRHLRSEGAGIGFARTSMMHGQIYYTTGGGALFFLLKFFHRLVFGRPIVLGGIMMLVGLVRAWLKDEPKLVSNDEAVRYRHLLNDRLLATWAAILGGPKPSDKTMGWS
jgi:biofilm PGA synthesis N-glycosyltransferase PgaC